VKIICLVKQVPRGDAIAFDEESKRLKREGVPLELNEPDRHAVAEAARLRDAVGGEVVAITMGPPQAADALTEAMALGADRAIHLSDRAFAVADTIGTSRTLAMAIAKEGGVDLVVCGRKALDAETWQVPPEVAAFLGVPHLTGVVALEPRGAGLLAVRESDEGEDAYELDLPALVSVSRSSAEPAPREGTIAVWAASDLVDDLREDDPRFGQTGSPTRVLAVRDVTPERAGEVAGSPREAADRIAALLAERAKPPSAWEKPERLGELPGHDYDCWSVVEARGDRAARAGLELLAKGRELAGKLGGVNVALVVGHGVEAATIDAVRHGAERVVIVDDATLAGYEPEAWAAAIREVVERERPHALLIPATANGRDYGPRVAGALELGMTGDCVDLGIDRGGRLIQFKPAYGGNIVSVIMGATTPQLATVRTRMFEPVEPRETASAEMARVAAPAGTARRVRQGERRSKSAGWQLDEADVVVCAGADVGAGKLEAMVGPLRAAVGADHAACLAGLVPWNRQIGLLGRQVAPRLYLAVGAAGDYEHLTGSVKAGVIAAVDATAGSDLLAAADVGLAGDWRELVPALVEALDGRL
jgi:electron transfer flavoprotein alpha subunit